MKKLIFLGGTCNGSLWREGLIPRLTNDFFNPVVPNWNEEAYQKELQMREEADLCLYYITPRMTGVYSIAEAVDDSNKRPEKTVFFIDPVDVNDYNEEIQFNEAQRKSMIATGKLIEKNGGFWAKDIMELLNYLNK